MKHRPDCWTVDTVGRAHDLALVQRLHYLDEELCAWCKQHPGPWRWRAYVFSANDSMWPETVKLDYCDVDCYLASKVESAIPEATP